MVISIDFWICAGSVLAYLIMALVFCLKINGLKKEFKNAGKAVEKPRYTYSLSLITAFVLLILPLLVPVATWVCAVVCGCGLMGEFIVFSERATKLVSK